jgi:hypothetical protein
MRSFDGEGKRGDSGAVILPACGLPHENKVGCRAGERLALALLRREPGVPPSPPSICGIITLARNSPQNPHDKELRGQNLDNKGLTGLRLALEQTVTASTMIADLELRGKVRCHSGAVENAPSMFCKYIVVIPRSGGRSRQCLAAILIVAEGAGGLRLRGARFAHRSPLRMTPFEEG